MGFLWHFTYVHVASIISTSMYLNKEGPTIADHQEHEGLVVQQPPDGGDVRVIFSGHVSGLRLRLGGRDFWFLLKHWKTICKWFLRTLLSLTFSVCLPVSCLVQMGSNVIVVTTSLDVTVFYSKLCSMIFVFGEKNVFAIAHPNGCFQHVTSGLHICQFVTQ